jgi:hypothetical protein
MAVPASLRTPRAAAVAGILFSVLFGLAFTLILVSAPSDPADAGPWLTNPHRRAAVALALNLVPFAAIAFLWFMGVVRDRIGQHEDRFFATVFLGSGLLFTAMMLVAAAVAGGMLSDPAIEAGRAPTPELWGFARRFSITLMNIYAIRMGAVFILSTTTIALRTRILPRWLGVGGYIVAVPLLISVSLSRWVILLFPAWTLVLSLNILFASLKPGRPAGVGSDVHVP